MKDNVKIFENAQFGQIRTSISASNEPLFCLADVCKALGLNGGAKNVRQRLNSKGVVLINTLTTGGEQQLNFINEANLYKCIFQSKKKSAEQFQDWVCEEVLPSIRTKGGYIVAHQEETPEQIMARALKIADDTIKRVQQQNTLLTQQIEQNKPKVLFADAVTASEDSILIGELATILNQKGVKIGQNRLFTYLRDNGYLCKEGERRNQPTQKALDLGLFQVKKSTINAPNGSIIVSSTTKVTGKGQIYFINKLIPVCYEC